MCSIKQTMKKFQKHVLFQHHVKSLVASAAIIIMSQKMVLSQSDVSVNITQMITQNVYHIVAWKPASALPLKVRLHVVVVTQLMLTRCSIIYFCLLFLLSPQWIDHAPFQVWLDFEPLKTSKILHWWLNEILLVTKKYQSKLQSTWSSYNTSAVKIFYLLLC